MSQGQTWDDWQQLPIFAELCGSHFCTQIPASPSISALRSLRPLGVPDTIFLQASTIHPIAPMSKKPPNCWLFKEEPEHYSFAQLEREGRTWWEGVTNALARKHLRQVAVGDRVLYYHTGSERAIVGEMRVVAGPQLEPGSEDPKSVAVEVEPVQRWPIPLTLGQLKQDAGLADWELVRLPRLSVMPVTAEQWKRIQQLRKALTTAVS